MNASSTIPIPSDQPVHLNPATDFHAVEGAVVDSTVRVRRDTLIGGLDWGTNRSCIFVSDVAGVALPTRHLVPTTVGYAKEGLVENLLPGNARILMGDEALRHRLHLKLVQPLTHGVIRHKESARAFAEHLKHLIAPADRPSEIRVVIGVPANASAESRMDVREAVSGIFDKVILVPEPFLAALGCRDESRLMESGYVDPVRNSLFIDIGAGTTDLCLIQGCYPGPEDQIGFTYAGDRIDESISEGIRAAFPENKLSLLRVRELKEQFAFVGQPIQEAKTEMVVDGLLRRIDITQLIGTACSELLNRVFEAVTKLLGRVDPDSLRELTQNIILTGGGSRIRNMDVELERRLRAAGFESAEVAIAGDNYKDFVALGALKAARHARESQWQKISK